MCFFQQSCVINCVQSIVYKTGKFELGNVDYIVVSTYCDAVVLVSIERYLESGQPDRFGIDIWGKLCLFNAVNMEPLYEHYTRRTLHPTDPGGGRERFIQKALEEYVELLLGSLPRKS